MTGMLLAAALELSSRLPDARIDPRIFAGRAEGERSAFLVVLRSQADLSGASAITDRVERRRFVYEGLRAHAELTQRALSDRLRARGVAFRSHYLVNALEVEGDARLARDLASSAEVYEIAGNREAFSTPLPVLDAPLAPPVGVEPNLEKVRAPEVWDRGFTGQGIVVGSADSGFQWDHPALRNRYRGWDGSSAVHEYNWHDAIHDASPANLCGSDAPAPCDDEGHGTATAGLAVGDDGAGNRIGVAPGARLIGCRNMDHGNGTPARYIECFEWLLAPTDTRGANPRPDLGADVVNNSWSCPASEGCTDPEILRAVVENVRAAGVAVVVAAGNGGTYCSNIAEAPSIYEASITVGATDDADLIANFSSLGPVTVDGSNRLKPDLCAPGVNVRSAEPLGAYRSNFSGTSAATPHVTGAIALLWSAIPGLAGNVVGTARVLEESALPLTGSMTCGGFEGSAVPNTVFGWGRLDVEAALEAAGGRALPILAGEQPPATRIVPDRP